MSSRERGSNSISSMGICPSAGWRFRTVRKVQPRRRSGRNRGIAPDPLSNAQSSVRKMHRKPFCRNQIGVLSQTLATFDAIAISPILRPPSIRILYLSASGYVATTKMESLCFQLLGPTWLHKAPGSPVGSCRSHTGRSSSDGNGASADAVRVAGVARPRPLPAGRRTWRQACSRPAACACRPGLRSFLHSLPFAFACAGSSSLEHNAGVLGTATPGVLRAFPHLSSPEVPSLRQRYPASPVSGRRRRPAGLASVRRSNGPYSFPVSRFHEGV